MTTDAVLHYRYRAARSDGRLVSGLVDAASATEASEVLVTRGLSPVSIRVADHGEGQRTAAGRRELAVLFQSLASLVAAGVPLERALASSEALTRGALHDAVSTARSKLGEGRTLAEALAASRGVVPSLVVGMIRAGERGSRLAAALDGVARHLEQEAEFIARVRQALAYPLLVAGVGTVSIVVIGTVVVPRFAELLGGMGQALPLATRLLLAGSTLLTRHGFVLLLLLVGLGWILAAWQRRPAGRLRRDRLLLALPLIGPVRHLLATSRVMRALGGMLVSGMPLLPALDAAREAASDLAVGERLAGAREQVAQGQPLTRSLERGQALSASALQLVAVGESSGALGPMALKAGDLAAQEAERSLRTLTGLLEPALVVVFGAMVAFVAAALLQAVYSIRPGGL